MGAQTRRRQIPPNVITYNALLCACAVSSRWLESTILLESARQACIVPDALVHGLVVAAFERSQRWVRWARLQQHTLAAFAFQHAELPVTTAPHCWVSGDP